MPAYQTYSSGNDTEPKTTEESGKRMAAMKGKPKFRSPIFHTLIVSVCVWLCVTACDQDIFYLRAVVLMCLP